MAFNKKARLRDNIEAIRLAFSLDKEGRQATPAERETLEACCGFGGIKAVLNPADKPEDVQHWTKTDSELFPLVTQLHDVLRSGSENTAEYNRYVSSLKNSVLSAFYTPPKVVDALAAALKESGIEPVRLLDPSAGTGTFSDAVRLLNPRCETTQFEKDMLTGKILSHLNPTGNVRVEGFENIEPRYNGYFDVAASNIPFGDVRVFDPAYSNAKDDAHRQASGAIHNYFFMKSVDCIREGGLVAFITSQGVLNSEANRPVREWLMRRCDPVSVIRLPNNLFTDFAGTEVGSDLIVLQKKELQVEYAADKKLWEQRRQDFINCRKLSNGISVNNLFQSFDRVIHDNVKVGTDPYGKPAMEFIHSGGMEAIAAELRGMLREDFSRHLDVELYKRNAPQVELKQERNVVTEEIKPQLKPDESRFPDDLDPFWQDIEDHWFPNEKEFWNKEEQTFARTLPKEDYPVIKKEPTPEIQEKPISPGVQTSLNFEYSNPVPPPAQSKEPTTEAKVGEPAYSINNQPLISLYDLFGLSVEERTQVKPKSNRSRRRMEIPQPQTGKREQKPQAPLDWREELMLKSRQKEQQAKQGSTVYPVADARKEEQLENLKREMEREERTKPIPFVLPEQGLAKHYKEGSLVTNADNRIGYLRDLNGFRPMFHPLELSPRQHKRASLYIEIRDAYHHLYMNETDTLRKTQPCVRCSTACTTILRRNSET